MQNIMSASAMQGSHKYKKPPQRVLHRDGEDGVPTVAYTYVTDNSYTTLDRWAACYTKCDTLATCILLENENRPLLAQLSKPA